MWVDQTRISGARIELCEERIGLRSGRTHPTGVVQFRPDAVQQHLQLLTDTRVG